MKIFKYIMFPFLVMLAGACQATVNKDALSRQCGSICPVQVGCPAGATGPCAIFNCIIAQQATFNTLTTQCLTVNGNLTVQDNVQVAGDVIVEEDVFVFGDECIAGDLQVGQTVTIGGDTLIEGNLTVNDGAFINKQLTVNGDETINGSLNVTVNANINQNITVGGTGTVGGLLTAAGGLSVFNGVTINTGGLIILSGGASINGNVLITGNQTVDDLEILGNLTVQENAFFNGCTTTVNGTLITNGPVIMNRGLTIASGDEIIDTGDLTIDVGNLTVGGSSTFNGPVVANNGATINNGLTVFGGQTIATGDLVVATCGNVTIGGNLTVNGTITSPSRAILASLVLTDTTNSTSPTTGTLIVNGGVGIAQDLWIGGSEFFSNVFTQGGIPSPFNYYEETCHTMAFRFDGNPNPVFVNIAIVRVGALVNLLIPAMVFGPGIGLVETVPGWELPSRFRPFCTVRGAASTIVFDGMGQLGEFEVRPDGTIIFGLPGPLLGPQPITSGTMVQVDINTITYNVVNCGGCTTQML